MFPLTPLCRYYFSVLGRALYTAQRFEWSCKFLAAMLEMQEAVTAHGLAVLEDEEFLSAVVKAWHRQLGPNMKYIAKRYSLPVDDPWLVDGREARNQLVHTSACNIDGEAAIETIMEERLRHVASLVSRIAAADKAAVFLAYKEGGQQLPEALYLRSYEKRVVEWVLSNGDDELRCASDSGIPL